MLAFLKKKTPHADPAKRAYAQILQHIRAPIFYTTYGVPDSFDGRFDLLLIHLFLVINRLANEGEQARNSTRPCSTLHSPIWTKPCARWGSVIWACPSTSAG
jgi:hypothetical protein